MVLPLETFSNKVDEMILKMKEAQDKKKKEVKSKDDNFDFKKTLMKQNNEDPGSAGLQGMILEDIIEEPLQKMRESLNNSDSHPLSDKQNQTNLMKDGKREFDHTFGKAPFKKHPNHAQYTSPLGQNGKPSIVFLRSDESSNESKIDKMLFTPDHRSRIGLKANIEGGITKVDNKLIIPLRNKPDPN